MQAENSTDSILEATIKTPSRYSKTVNFSPTEFAQLDQIFTARQQAGISTDYSHFIRQCMDYAINNLHKVRSFAKPTDAQLTLKNTFKPLD